MNSKFLVFAAFAVLIAISQAHPYGEKPTFVPVPQPSVPADHNPYVFFGHQNDYHGWGHNFPFNYHFHNHHDNHHDIPHPAGVELNKDQVHDILGH